MDDKKLNRRFLVFEVVSALVILFIIIKFFTMMVLPESKVKDTASPPKVERGPIMDRNGRILAIQNQLDSVETWIPYIDNPEETAGLLADILSIDSSALLSDFRTKSGSIWIKRKISPTESDAIKALKEKDKLKGIYLRKEYGRNYPEQRLASHIIGYAGTDNIGLDGIEYSMNDVLSPPADKLKNGKNLYGNQLFLTIDVNIQFFAEKHAREAYEQHKADSVTIIVLDADNGDILASASIPDFDPNTFYNFSEEERSNRALTASYEPGSVMKVFSIASFLQLQGITPESRFYCNGSYTNDLIPKPIRCLGTHGSVTPADIIKYSCNAGTAYASDTVSNEDFYNMLIALGFGNQTQLPLPGESFGLLRSPEKWSARSKPTIAFGQELLVSAVQIAAAATAFSNDGILLKPHIVDRIISPDGQIIEDVQREPIRRVFSPDVARSMLLMMETATEDGGGSHRIRTEGIRISAKTGTSQVIDPRTGTYSTEDYTASCIALLPTEAPEVIVYTVIRNPKGFSYYGGRIAAPVSKKVIDDLIPYMEIPRKTDSVLQHSGSIHIKPSTSVSAGETVPDLSGKTKRQLLPLLEDERFTLSITGDGWVVRQRPEAGTPVSDGMTIEVELE